MTDRWRAIPGGAGSTSGPPGRGRARGSHRGRRHLR